jgi:integral membrane sensor domain MASE1
MSRWLPQAILLVVLYATAAILDPCGDGGCTLAEERASHAR